MDVCQHAWLCFINVLIAGIKPSPLIHPNAPYSCWEVEEDDRRSSKGHISSVFYPTTLSPVPFPHLQSHQSCTFADLSILFAAYSTSRLLAPWSSYSLTSSGRILRREQSCCQSPWAGLTQLSNHLLSPCLDSRAASPSQLLLQLHSLPVRTALSTRQRYALGTRTKCWSRSLPLWSCCP